MLKSLTVALGLKHANNQTFFFQMHLFRQIYPKVLQRWSSENVSVHTVVLWPTAFIESVKILKFLQDVLLPLFSSEFAFQSLV